MQVLCLLHHCLKALQSKLSHKLLYPQYKLYFLTNHVHDEFQLTLHTLKLLICNVGNSKTIQSQMSLAAGLTRPMIGLLQVVPATCFLQWLIQLQRIPKKS